MRLTNGSSFTTVDRDNDRYKANCASLYGGAWWMNSCFHSHLNGPNIPSTKLTPSQGIIWHTFRGSHHGMSEGEIAIRPR